MDSYLEQHVDISEDNFNNIADILMNDTVIVICGVYFRIYELEFILSANNITKCSIQFKKKGKYDHMYIVLKNYNILIKSLYDIDQDVLMDSPSGCIHMICAEFGHKSVQDLFGYLPFDAFINTVDLSLKHIEVDMFDDFLCKSNVYKGINNRYAIYINRVTNNKKSFVLIKQY